MRNLLRTLIIFALLALAVVLIWHLSGLSLQPARNLVSRWLPVKPATTQTTSSPIPQAGSSATVPAEGHFWGGQPRSPYPLTVCVNTAYVAGYDETIKNPRWVGWRMFPNRGGKSADRPESFYRDPRSKAGVVTTDYNRSGFDRGHMCPNYAAWCLYGEKAQLETFFLTNIIPQTAKLNRGWWMDFEQKIIHDYANRSKALFEQTGPVFNDPDNPAPKLPKGIAVPAACYLILARPTTSGDVQVMALIVPQDTERNVPAERFLVSVRDIERATGLDFFPDFPQELQDRIETIRQQRAW